MGIHRSNQLVSSLPAPTIICTSLRFGGATGVNGLRPVRVFLTQNDCTPSCVAGHFHDYPAVVVVVGREGCPNGQIAYQRVAYVRLIAGVAGCRTYDDVAVSAICSTSADGTVDRATGQCRASRER